MTIAPRVLDDLSLVCLACADLDATVRQCQDLLGIGPWEIYDFAPPIQYDTKLRGKDEPFTMRVAFSAVGDVGWALLEPKSGSSIYAEFLAEHGSGLHHAAFLHDGFSYDQTIAEFTRRGFPVVQQGNFCGRYCYLDTRERAHMIFELIEDGDAEMQGLIYRYPDPADDAAPPVFDATCAIGFVTSDLDETRSVYEGLGIGPWLGGEADAVSGIRRSTASIGRSAVELVQPGQGPSVYREFLERRGTGVHHLSLGHAKLGYEACRSKFAAAGIATVGEGEVDGRRVGYLETEAILGVRIQITD
ncbi:MAG: VOC family protein [Alphaproteobacteria bacterium]